MAGNSIYQGSYIDLVLCAETERGTLALVAGTHTRRFPYFETEPWDNCLLLIGDTGYTFTGRSPGAALQLELELDLDRDQPAPRGRIRFAGEMRQATSGAPVRVELDLPVALTRLPTRELGESYNVLELDGAIGMRYTPYGLTGETGSVRVAGGELAITGIRGSCERGVLTNLRSREFAIKYDYLGVACPGRDGYGLIEFTSHTLFEGGLLNRALDWYLGKSASATMTIAGGELVDGNPRGVYSPPQDDGSVVLFDTEVDLGPAVLKRQMVETHDAAGRKLHGLREIFTAKPERVRRRWLELTRAQVNALLVALIALDLVLAVFALGFPERWSQAMYGQPYVDPAGLLRRTGAVWAAFTLLQLIALVRWQHQPYWLPLVAGVRLTELFSDWVAIAAADQITTLGAIGLAISPPANLCFGVVLIATYRRWIAGPAPGRPRLTKP